MWEMNQNSRVLYGPGKIKEIAGILSWFRLRKVFIVTYSADAAAIKTISKDLIDKGIGYCIYDQVKSEPDLHVIDAGAELLTKEKCDVVLGIGGGSVLDTAKVIAMLATNGGPVEDYQMNGKPIVEDALPFIAVPTTSGTGAEATRVSVIYNNHNGLKKSVYSPCMIADVAVLDPTVTVDLPPAITASTGIDALSHAIESYVSLNATPYTEMFGLKAMELINRSLVQAVDDGKNLDARGDMMLASFMAGCAISAGIGIAHIIAQPLGGMYKIPHGEACSIFLPLAMSANLEYSARKYRQIGEALGCGGTNLTDIEIGKAAIERVYQLIAQVGTARKFGGYLHGDKFDLEKTLDVIYAATGHIKCNPRPVDRELLVEMLQQAL